jgi:hypothetical protein
MIDNPNNATRERFLAQQRAQAEQIPTRLPDEVFDRICNEWDDIEPAEKVREILDDWLSELRSD